MAENDPKNNDGLSPEELDQQEVSDLPNREAMSLISTDPMPPIYLDDDPILSRYPEPPVEKPEAV